MAGAISFSRMRQALSNAQEMDKQIQQQRAQAQAAQTLQSRPYAIDERAFGVARQPISVPSPWPTWNQTSQYRSHLPGGEWQGPLTQGQLIEQATKGFADFNQRYDDAAQSYRDAARRETALLDPYDPLSLQRAGTGAAAADRAAVQTEWYQVAQDALWKIGPEGRAKLEQLVKDDAAWKEANPFGGYRDNSLRNELEELYGKELVDNLTEYIRQVGNAEVMAQRKQEAQSLGKESGAAAVATVPARLVSGIEGTAGMLAQKGERLFSGSRAPLDWNDPSQTGTNVTGAVREGATSELGPVGKFLANTGFSIADSVAAAALGSYGAPLLATAAANASMQEAKARGASDDQAISLGLISGVAEAVTEKVSIDHLFSLKSAESIKDVLMNAVKQAVPEAGEEAISSVVNLLADSVIMGEKSQYRQLVESGLTSEQAFLELAKEVGLDALGGGLSGFVMGSVKSAVDFAANHNSQAVAADQTEAQKAAEPAQAEETEIQGIMKKILEMPRINNTVANMIIQDPEAAAEFEKQTGVQLTGTTEQKRQTIKDTVRDMRRQPVEAVEAHEQTATPQTAEPAQAAQAVTPEQKPEAQPVQTPKTTAQIMEEAAQGMVGKPDDLGGSDTADGVLDEEALPAMGAADAGFAGDIGAWKWDTEDTIKNTQLPKTDKSGNLISDTAGSLFEANVPRETKEAIERYAYEGEFSYGPLANNQVVEEVHRELERDGFDTVYGQVTSDLMNRKASPYTTAKAWVLYVQSANRGLDDKAAMLSKLLANYNTDVARALQINSIYSKLTPEGRFAAIQRVVDGLNNEILSSDTAQIQIDERLQQEYFQAKTPEEIAAAEKKIYASIGRQIPSTGADKWNAWRYMSMLGNFKTPLRDVFGNITHAGMRAVRDAVSSGVEAISQKAGWIDQKDRTKAILTPKDRELLNAAKADYENVAGYITDGDKWNTAPDEIRKNQRVYKNGVLEAARVGLDKFGKWRDKPFAQGAYAKALAGYLKAQGFSAQDFTGGRMTQQQKEAARSYAIKEAKEATFRQVSDFSQWVSRIGQKRSGKNDSKTIQALDTFGHTLVEGQMPFKRTPANILVTGAVDYSPAGLLKTIVFDSRKVKRGEMTPAQYISNLSSGLTGTAITGLGYLLADLGIITGGTPEDEEQFELEGRQAYSLQIGGKSISLAWLAPASMPLFLGVAIHDLFAAEKKNVPAMDKVLGALQGLTEPILETSMMSGLQESLESVEWADNKIGAFVGNAMLSYIKQAFPTVFGQIERVFEPSYRETTFTQDGERILNKDAQYTLGNIGNKVPFADYQQIPYIDAWGRTQSEGGTVEKVFNNLFNPAYVSDIRETDVDKEIKRLEAVTGENYTPSRADKKITINETAYLLTADEYLTYATAKGQNDFTIRTNAMDSENYELLTDAMKGKVHEYSEELANYLAKKEAGFDDPNAAKWMVELSEADAETVTKAIIKKAVENIGGLGKPIKFDASWAVVSGDVMDGAMKKAQAYADAVALEEMGYPMETDWMLKAKEAKTDRERQDLFMAAAVDAQAKKVGDGKKYVGLSEMLEDGDVDDKVALLVLPPDVVKRKTDRKIKVSATLLVDALAFSNSDAASSGKKDKNGKYLDGEGPQDKVYEYLRKDRRLPTSQANKVMACLYEGWGR